MNGQVVRTLGTRVRPGRDFIRVDGETVRAEAPVTILLHKPAGYITSRSDPQGRPVVTSLLPQAGLPRLFPVGRLDWDTEGLLLLTNDGVLANALTHPRYAVRKVYRAKLKGHSTTEALALFTRGVVCDGEPLRALAVEVLHPTRQNTWVAITLEQGRYRQVRRMCEAIGHPVLKLIRVALGPLTLGSLPRGQWRERSRRPNFGVCMRSCPRRRFRADSDRDGRQRTGPFHAVPTRGVPGSPCRPAKTEKDLDRPGSPGYHAARMDRKR